MSSAGAGGSLFGYYPGISIRTPPYTCGIGLRNAEGITWLTAESVFRLGSRLKEYGIADLSWKQ